MRKSFSYENKVLSCQGVSLKDLALRSFGTPFYVYNLETILDRTREYQKNFGSRSQIHYAMKCNSNRTILRELSKLGVGVDVVSGGELERALECGFEAKNIVFSGVAKSKREIEVALRESVKLINVESVQELERIIELAKKMNSYARLGFRVNPDVDAKTHPYITTGLVENKFGIPLGQLPLVTEILKENRDCAGLVGIGFHIGSQIIDLHAFEEAAEKTAPIFNELKRKFETLQYFNVGGGLGISYDPHIQSPSISDYVRGLKPVLDALDCEVICEPGRSIIAESGALVAEVEYIKRTDQKTFAILNTGMHHLLRPALYGSVHEIKSVDERDQILKERYDIVGPICESTDVLAKDRELPRLEQGDLVAIMDTGAYGYCMANRYNLHSLPKEYVIAQGKAL